MLFRFLMIAKFFHGLNWTSHKGLSIVYILTCLTLDWYKVTKEYNQLYLATLIDFEWEQAVMLVHESPLWSPMFCLVMGSCKGVTRVHTLATAGACLLRHCTATGSIQSTNRLCNHTQSSHMCSSVGKKETVYIVTLFFWSKFKPLPTNQ